MTQMDALLRSRFGFTTRPFCPLADSSSFHWNRRHTRAFAALEFGLLSGAAFSVLTGPSGCGKTALMRRLMEQADQEVRFVMADAGFGGDPILTWILQALDVVQPTDPGLPAVLRVLQDAVIAEYAAGRTTVLIIDEAHNLSDGELESLRLLSNINTAQDQLLQIVLSGQPSLRARLSMPGLASLAQRVSVWASVDALDLQSTADYVADRLRAAGAVPDLFDAGALSLIHATTGGIPRQINTLCELALIFAMAEPVDQIGVGPVRQVLADGFFLPAAEAPQGASDRPSRLSLAVGA